MNALEKLAAVLLVTCLPSQSPLVTAYAANGGGQAGGQVLFDLTGPDRTLNFLHAGSYTL